MKNIILLSTVLSSLIYAAGPVYKTGITSESSWIEKIKGADSTYESGINANFTQNSNETITDNTLKLKWQNNFDKNDLNNSIPNLNYDEAKKYCETLNLGNLPIGSWDLPTRLEAKSIVEYFWDSPSVFEVFKEQTLIKVVSIDKISNIEDEDFEFYWTRTDKYNDPSQAWRVEYYSGADGYTADKSNLHRVRCVNRDKFITASYDKSNGIVTDNDTKLMWQDDYDNDPNTINDTLYTSSWEEAINYCENNLSLGGYSDWRLPNFNELYFITDDNKSQYAIDDIFKNTSTNYYWSSTLSKESSKYVRVVNFEKGHNHFKLKENEYNVRCVRGTVRGKSTSITSIINYLLN